MILHRIINKIIRKIYDYEAMPNVGESAFNWDHLPDERLYTDNDYALQLLKTEANAKRTEDYKNYSGPKAIYHCYWYGSVGRKQAFSIKSFLCTQNLNKCQLILWLDIDDGFKGHEQNPLLKPLLPLITVKAFDPATEIKNTPWQNNIKLINRSENLAKRSDAFRFIVLYNYGGVYFDLDVMFLRNFDDLIDREFCYAWETQPFANSAVFNLKCKSEIAGYILNKCIKKKTVLPWIILNYADLTLKKLFVLPCAYFDPIWQGIKTIKTPIADFESFFLPFDANFNNHLNILSYSDFFPGCYAYHWHNQWNSAEYANSFFGIFENEFDRMLKIS